MSYFSDPVVEFESLHSLPSSFNNIETIGVDLGCGRKPRNLYKCDIFYGIDIISDVANVKYCHLGQETLPFEDSSVHAITAYDVLEHIPRTQNDNKNPFIFLMNEIYRVLKPGGVFLSLTPVYPYPASFQDPTHVNFITPETFVKYFSKDKYEVAKDYGIKCDFIVKEQRLWGQHLLCILNKPG